MRGTDEAARARRRGGFTLIELMAVVAILGLLATVVAVNLGDRKATADRARVQTDMSAILQGIMAFRLDVGRRPRAFEELWVRPADARRWGPNPYIEPSPPRDPWGNLYDLAYEGDRAVLTSYGADGAPGGEGEDADLVSLELLGR